MKTPTETFIQSLLDQVNHQIQAGLDSEPLNEIAEAIREGQRMIKKYSQLKACPWRMANHATVGNARCLKGYCVAWDDKTGCKLIEIKGDEK